MKAHANEVLKVREKEQFLFDNGHLNYNNELEDGRNNQKREGKRLYQSATRLLTCYINPAGGVDHPAFKLDLFLGLNFTAKGIGIVVTAKQVRI